MGSPIPRREPQPNQAIAWSLFAAFVLLPAGVAAQCDADKIQKAVGGANGYRQVHASMCEGFYGRNVSGAVLTFVGLTEPKYLDTHDLVRIGWPLPPEGLAPEQVVHVLAQSWSGPAFQMDALATGDSGLEWSVDALRNEGIPLNDVGLLGWLETGEHRLYVPLRVSQETDAEPDTEYVFQVVANARLSSVAVTLAQVESAGQRPTGDLIRNQEKGRQRMPSVGQPLEIWIPHAELPSPGVYFMEIFATQEGESTPDTVTLWFLHST